MASLLRRVHAKGGVLMKFELAPSLLRWLLGFVWVESVLMACMGSVSSPSSAIQGSRQSERHQACEASSKCEIRHTSRNKAALRALVRSSAGRSLGGRRAMLALISVAHLDVVEGKWLIEFPSGFRCIWNDLPHGLQFAILFLRKYMHGGISAPSVFLAVPENESKLRKRGPPHPPTCNTICTRRIGDKTAS
ncbi:unnamed protein product [Ectocarpus sp. 12 AP-2014]